MGGISSLASTGVNLALAQQDSRRLRRERNREIEEINAQGAERRRQREADLRARIAALRARTGASGVQSTGGSIDAVVRGLEQASARESDFADRAATRRIGSVRQDSADRRRRNLLNTGNALGCSDDSFVVALGATEAATSMSDASKESPNSFAQFVWHWNKAQGLSTPKLHIELSEWLDDRWTSGDKRLALTVFRNAGKSTLVALFAAWLLVRDANLRILIVSAEAALATKMTRHIRQIVGQHPHAQHLRPDEVSEWAADRLTVMRTAAWRDPSILARGLSANLTGCRADVIICDDVEVPNTCDTPSKRQELRQRLKELEFILVPGGLHFGWNTPSFLFNLLGEPRAGNRQFRSIYRWF